MGGGGASPWLFTGLGNVEGKGVNDWLVTGRDRREGLDGEVFCWLVFVRSWEWV